MLSLINCLNLGAHNICIKKVTNEETDGNDICRINSKNIKETLEGRKKSSGYLRSELAKRINMRNTPELVFELDESLEYGARIDSLLNEIKNKENK